MQAADSVGLDAGVVLGRATQQLQALRKRAQQGCTPGSMMLRFCTRPALPMHYAAATTQWVPACSQHRYLLFMHCQMHAVQAGRAGEFPAAVQRTCTIWCHSHPLRPPGTSLPALLAAGRLRGLPALWRVPWPPRAAPARRIRAHACRSLNPEKATWTRTHGTGGCNHAGGLSTTASHPGKLSTYVRT